MATITPQEQAEIDATKAGDKLVKCLTCGAVYLTPFWILPPIWGTKGREMHQIHCDACIEAHEREQGEAETRRRRASLRADKLVPKRYRGMTLDALKPRHQEAARSCLDSYRWGAKGLVIRGAVPDTRNCIMWMLIERLVCEGRSLVACSATHFLTKLHNYQGREAFLDRGKRASIFFLSNLGDADFTKTAFEYLADVIDARYESQLPVFVSTAYAGDSLAERFGDAGKMIIQRLREECNHVNLN